jgi:hypothetical protein
MTALTWILAIAAGLITGCVVWHLLTRPKKVPVRTEGE